ncbi:TIM barrel protein [Solirhodobacter olei]|uniref:TIM barrel protein n=1 Tax=Solirhodobacter olei TaxID=2493082 RepID=UPI0019D420DF|nr:TIM barrel protein [Solirhodobacter olei]
MIARALNQKTARHLSYEAFLDLAQALDCVGVEVRNDLGRPLFDGIPPKEAGRLAHARGLRLLGLSEIYPFNDWTSDRARELRSLVGDAQAAGAETISLVPRVDGLGSEAGVRQRVLREVMREILAIIADTSVVALIEPIGFPLSSLRHKAELVEAIDAVDRGGAFRLVHDTFQHVLAGEAELFSPYTGIVHISGLSAPEAILDETQDAHRVLVDANDRCGNVDQIERFLAAGYSRCFSFECTAPSVQESHTLEEDIRRSFDYIEARVGVCGKSER